MMRVDDSNFTSSTLAVLPATPHHLLRSPTLSSPRKRTIRSPPTSSPRKNKPRPVEDLFPSKLYDMLEKVESLDLAAAVSWRPHGRAFVIKDKELFMSEVIPRFFKATKIRSFQRQCHLWGFHRIATGRDAGSWWHEYFLRGRPQLLKHIVRTRVKGMASSVANVPDFYADNDNNKVPDEADVDELVHQEKEEKKEEGQQPPLVEISSFETTFGPFDSKLSGEVSSVSANSGSEREENEYEHLDEELEAWFEETTPRHVVSNSHPQFGTSAPPSFPDLNCSSDGGNSYGRKINLRKKEMGQGQSPTGRMRSASIHFPTPSSSMDDVAAGANQSHPHWNGRSYTLSPRRALGNTDYQPAGASAVDWGRHVDTSKQEDVDDRDEFSEFIDKMLFQLP